LVENGCLIYNKYIFCSHVGDIFAPTAKSPPWSGFNDSSRKNNIDFIEDEDVFGEEYYNELKKFF